MSPEGHRRSSRAGNLENVEQNTSSQEVVPPTMSQEEPTTFGWGPDGWMDSSQPESTEAGPSTPLQVPQSSDRQQQTEDNT